MSLYSIFPLLTLGCFLGLTVLTILRSAKTKARILFLLICILGSFLYIDILCALNVKSAKTALLVSRTDHFFIVYLFPIYLHFFSCLSRYIRTKMACPGCIYICIYLDVLYTNFSLY
jgi:hypothetical protein